MRKIVSLFAVLMVFTTLAFAQTRTISGQIRDEKGEPVSFATVLEKGTKNATRADGSGNFSLKIKEGSQLTITATGFGESTVTPGTGLVSVLMTTQSSGLQEVIVTTALGQVRQSKELGYSTAKVKSSELIQARVVNLQNGLTGKVSGLK